MEKSKKRGWYWPYAIGGFLAVAAICDLMVVYVAATHPSFAVEEDYYQKALDWDERKDQLRRNAELGWKLDIGLIPPPPGVVQRVEFVVRLEGPDGEALEGATVQVHTFHNARPKAVLSDALESTGDGVYRGYLPMKRPGIWQVDIEVRRGEVLFTHSSSEVL